jgi:membrane-associated phospholipid phosphatase
MKFAKILSLVFHPLWMPLIIYTVSRWSDKFILVSPALNGFILLLLAINIIAPAISILIMTKFGMLTSIELDKRSERMGPYLLVLFYFVMSYLVLRMKATFIPPELLKWFLAVIISLALALVINQFWKISVHMLAQGGMFGMLLALQKVHEVPIMFAIAASLVAAGLTGYARVKLGAHTHNQVYAGFLLGLVVTYFTVTWI